MLLCIKYGRYLLFAIRFQVLLTIIQWYNVVKKVCPFYNLLWLVKERPPFDSQPSVVEEGPSL